MSLALFLSAALFGIAALALMEWFSLPVPAAPAVRAVGRADRVAYWEGLALAASARGDYVAADVHAEAAAMAREGL